LAMPFRLFVGGKIGTGQQGISWIHLDDAVRALALCIDDETMPGKVNVCSPNPASNEEVSAAIAKALHPAELAHGAGVRHEAAVRRGCGYDFDRAVRGAGGAAAVLGEGRDFSARGAATSVERIVASRNSNPADEQPHLNAALRREHAEPQARVTAGLVIVVVQRIAGAPRVKHLWEAGIDRNGGCR
jgi:hypothetical protein